MNRESFIQLIKNPDDIRKEHLPELDVVAAHYPWFFGARQLQLYYHRKNNDIQFQDYLKKWALLSPSPEKLYFFLNEEADLPDSAGVIQQTVVSEEVSVTEAENSIATAGSSVAEQSGENIQAKSNETNNIQETLSKNINEVPEETLSESSEVFVAADLSLPVTSERVKESEIQETDSMNMIEVPARPVTTHAEETAPVPETPEEPIIVRETEPIQESIPVKPEKEQEPVKEKAPARQEVMDDNKEVPEESWADIMLRRVAEIKKKRESEAAVKKQEPQSTCENSRESAPVSEVIPVLIPVAHDTSGNIPLANAAEKAESNISFSNLNPPVHNEKEKDVIHDLPSDSLPEEKTAENDTSDSIFRSRIAGLLSDTDLPAEKDILHTGSTSNKLTIADSPAEETTPDAEIKQEIPFELYVPVYDISSLEKEAEKEIVADLSQKKMDFNGWLDLINRQIAEKQPEKDNNQDIIERFIREKPRIVIRHDEESPLQPPETANTEESEPAACSETLASILIMQKKYNEAEEMYKKLSLLYPEKSVYFAAQIEKLRNNQV
jgi:hypothetical protein